jgi:hypothetical protein
MDHEISQLAFRELLSDADLAAILDLRQTMTRRYQRCKRLDHFRESLTVLCSFVDQQRDDDWKRALVTGICPCGAVLAVNNARLQAFTNRSKSSINDLFSKLRYQQIAINQRNQVLIIERIPFLEAHNDELRQWTSGRRAARLRSRSPRSAPRKSSAPPRPPRKPATRTAARALSRAGRTGSRPRGTIAPSRREVTPRWLNGHGPRSPLFLGS